jgi:hypothetical protein
MNTLAMRSSAGVFNVLPHLPALTDHDMNKELKKYLARIGRRVGKVRSKAKAEAARKNAKKGGWPKGRKRKP